jgi:hypothetical protein
MSAAVILLASLALILQVSLPYKTTGRASMRRTADTLGQITKQIHKLQRN